MRGYVVAQPPDPLTEPDIWVADNRRVAEVRSSFRRARFRELAQGFQAPQSVKYLDVNQVRSVEVSILT
jgi:hypothetical protein